MRPLTSKRHGTSGFSLVEIMIGMSIGAVAVALMMQFFATSEGQKRSITGGGNAQTNGSIALKGLQGDILKSGWGIDYNLLGCLAGVIPLVPVTINSLLVAPGDPNTDTVLVVYGNGIGSPAGDSIVLQPAANSYRVPTPAAFAAGDVVIAQPQLPLNAKFQTPPCTTVLAPTNVVNVVGNTVTVAAGVPGMANGILFNLGSGITVNAYAIRGGRLTVCDYTVNDCSLVANATDQNVWVPLVNGIVSLRAQYGRDTLTAQTGLPPDPTAPNYFTVDTWDQTPPTCWARVTSVRLALVARNDEYNKLSQDAQGNDLPPVTTAAPVWAGSAGAPINLSADPNWGFYRYRLFQAVFPLRNMAWINEPPQC